MNYRVHVVLALLIGSGSLVAQAPNIRVVVGFKCDLDPALVAGVGGSVLHGITSSNAVVALLPPAAVARLRSNPGVAFVEEDGIVALFEKGGKGGGGGNKKKPPAPPPQAIPWGILRVGGARSGAGVRIAILDTGADLEHPDLQANIKGGVNYVSPSKAPKDDNGHGSHVAGTIGAVDNTIGVVGVATQAWLYPVKVLDRRGSGWWSDVALGIDWTRQNGMHLANMSLGSSSAPSYVETSCDAAEAHGVLLLASAGNNGDGSLATTEINFPAGYASVVAVGATDIYDQLASFSATNPDLAANGVSGPGVDIHSTWKRGGYRTISGTSMACPHAVGVAAVIWASLLSPDSVSVRAQLRNRAEDLGLPGSDNGYGAGGVRHHQ